MKASVFQPSSREPAGEPKRRHLRVVHHKAHPGEAERSGIPPRWIALTVAVAVAAALVAAGLTYLWQRGADEAPAVETQTGTAAARQAAADLALANEELTAALDRATVADRRVSALEVRLARTTAALDASRNAPAAPARRIATLTAANQALEGRLQTAFAARREAVAAAAALLGTPLADGMYLTTFKAVGGTQSPPFAVLHLRGDPEWKVLQIAKSANVRVLGPNGLRSVTLGRFHEMFAPGSANSSELASSDFRVAVKGDRITGITELN